MLASGIPTMRERGASDCVCVPVCFSFWFVKERYGPASLSRCAQWRDLLHALLTYIFLVCAWVLFFRNYDPWQIVIFALFHEIPDQALLQKVERIVLLRLPWN